MVKNKQQLRKTIKREELIKELSAFEQRLGSRISGVEQRLAARIDSQIDAAAYSFKEYVDSRWHHLDVKFSKRFDSLDNRFDTLGRKADGLERKVDGVDKKLGVSVAGLVELIERRSGEIGEIENRVTSLESKA